jgi:23S rRNA U2552 (ribose-2'-O)-methylase RlmE/FtsJ
MLSQDEIKAVVGLFPFLREDFNVIDVGSNKGHWADLFVQEFKERGRIILFEPNDMLLNYTRINTNQIFGMTVALLTGSPG